MSSSRRKESTQSTNELEQTLRVEKQLVTHQSLLEGSTHEGISCSRVTEDLEVNPEEGEVDDEGEEDETDDACEEVLGESFLKSEQATLA